MLVAARRPGVALAPLPAVRGALLAALAIVLLAAPQGGYFPNAWRAGTVALAAAAGLIALRESRRLGRTAIATAALLALLLALSLASTLWSIDPHSSALEAQRTLLYVAAFAAFALAGDGLEAGVVLGASAVAVWALSDRLVQGAPIDPYEGRLLTGPLGYANGLAALVAIAAAVTTIAAVKQRRVLFAAPLLVLLPALALSNSRASWIALAIALLGSAGASAGGLALAALLVVAPSSVGDRAAWWHTARTAGFHHPLQGAGAGTFHDLYQSLPAAHDAHSLYLQTFAELGVPGLLLVVALVVLPIVAAFRTGQTAVAAGLVVFALHTGVDWDWQLPAVTVAWLALAARASVSSPLNLRIPRHGENHLRRSNRRWE
jgi:hypothetical protein